MNITLEAKTAASNANRSTSITTDKPTTTYKETATVGITTGNGYTLDIADKVMDDKAYQGHGMTTDDIMQKAQNTNAQAQKDFMIVMSNSVSGEDLERMQEEGFRPGSVEVETYVSIVDKIKVTLAKAGVEVKGFTDEIDAATVEEITGSKIEAGRLLELLGKNDIPVTKENLEAIAKALATAGELTDLSEDAMKYMLMNQMTPTIDNLYKAQFSSATELRQAKGYYSDSGYLAKKADNINWDNLQNQIEKAIKQFGLEVNKDTIDQAKWLIASGIELTSENMTHMSELSKLQLPEDTDKVMEYVVTAMANGKQPSQTLLTGEVPVQQQAQEILEEVQNISDEAIHNVIKNEEELTIQNLAKAQKDIDAKNTISEEELTQVSLKELEARRQMEEIRLMMTVEANCRLLKSGMSVDTTELARLVEALKTAEESMKAAFFQGKTPEDNVKMAEIYEETLETSKDIARMPAAVIGKMTYVSRIEDCTLEQLHKEGQELQQKYEKAEETYEALMTAPRKDLGDNIKKAFRNIDDILDDLKLEQTEDNRRAVRILGYNSMEITKENISAVKNADSLISGVIKRMTPATTLQMIREQKNPLEMSMKELDDYLSDKDKDVLEDAEKFSKYLQKLDRTSKISEEERQAYIGIYRMFRQIEKTDGAAIGSIIATGAEVNFKNVLSAIRSSNAKNDIDVKIDQDYGALENLITKGKAIDAQIQTGFEADENKNTASDEQTQKYYARLSGEIKDTLANETTVGDLKEVTGKINENTTIEEFADKLDEQITENKNDSVKLRQVKANFEAYRESVKEAVHIKEGVIQTLIDFEQPISMDNIEGVTELMEEPGQMFRKVIESQIHNRKEKNDTNVTNEETDSDKLIDNTILDEADKIIDNLTDKKSAVTSYQEMIKEATKSVEQVIYKAGTNNIDVKAAKSLYKGLKLAGNMAKQENYEVPIVIKGEVTSVNLKIYHNSSKAGKVTVTMDTEKLGKVAAEFDVTKDKVSGIVAYDNKSCQKDVESLKKTMQEELVKAHADEGINKAVSISIANAPKLDLNNFGRDRDPNETENLSSKELYKTAKAFMVALSNC